MYIFYYYLYYYCVRAIYTQYLVAQYIRVYLFISLSSEIMFFHVVTFCLLKDLIYIPLLF